MNRLQELLLPSFLRMSINSVAAGNSLVGLYDLVRDYLKKDFIMAEIGCFEGSSTELFALHCKKIYAIDPFDNVTQESNTHEKGRLIEAEKTFLERMNNYDNVEIIKNYSRNAVTQFEDNVLDFVYIDGNHKYEYVLQDIGLWSKKVRFGGIIAGHDYGDPEVTKAINNSLGKPDKVYEDTSWVVVKT